MKGASALSFVPYCLRMRVIGYVRCICLGATTKAGRVARDTGSTRDEAASSQSRDADFVPVRLPFRRHARLLTMQRLKAKVVNGHYVIQDAADLPEGTELYLVRADDDDDMTSDERAEIERLVEEGIED